MSARAYSIDGHTFEFDAPLNAALPVGAYVKIVADDAEYLGQILREVVERPQGAEDRNRSSARTIVGEGVLLGRLGVDGSDRTDEAPAAFGDADMVPADHMLVAAHLRSTRASGAAIELGSLQQMNDVPASLLAKGFGRHTFLCGQSGSGKTYTLGVVLERLLLETGIKIVVLDPNSDFVNLGLLRPQPDTGLTTDAYEGFARRHADIAGLIHVFGGEGSPNRLRALYGRLSLRQQTMVLGLDPSANPEEYNAFVRTVRTIGKTDYSLEDFMQAVRSSFDDDVRRLGLRIENFGVMEQSIWAGSGQQMMDVLPDDWRMIVADFGSLPSGGEGSIAAAALLGYLWEHRHRREPVLIVIDEAHNVCPQHPIDSNQSLATEHVVRMAGEGRKYGLYLLLSTQRPSKVHQNVLSQCDNLLLMKMNSATDLKALSETFSYAPAGLVGLAAGFGLGEGLAAGKIAPDPLLFKSGRRFTVEGGTDVPASWARARS